MAFLLLMFRFMFKLLPRFELRLRGGQISFDVVDFVVPWLPSASGRSDISRGFVPQSPFLSSFPESVIG